MALRKTIFALSLATLTVSTAFAQTAPVAGHPRVNEVDQRLENQQNRVDSGVASGTINAKQEARDNARDTRVSQQLSADEAKHNGHITKKEQTQLNKELNHNSGDIKRQKEVPGSGTAAK